MFHFCFRQSTFHLIHLIIVISFIFTIFGCIHITCSFNLIVSFTFQPISSLEINNLRMSLDKFLILNRYSLLDAELRWFFYSLSLYIKQEMQHQSAKVTYSVPQKPPQSFLKYFETSWCLTKFPFHLK